MLSASYAIALGSNRPHHRHGSPRRVIEAAFAALEAHGLRLAARSDIIESPPVGPSRRTYANAAALVETRLDPPALLAALKTLERQFGRRNGQRWGARTLDLDIILWSGGRMRGRTLAIPHPAFRARDFVLAPLVPIAPDWRDPVTGFTLRQLHGRAKKPKPVDRAEKPH